MQVPVGFDYVLVLEWLSDGDERTGSVAMISMRSLSAIRIVAPQVF